MRRFMMGGLVVGGVLGAAAMATAMMSMPKVRDPIVRTMRCHGRKLMRRAGQLGLL